MEVVGTSALIPITSADSSQVGQARRRAISLANALEFGEIRVGELSIIVTEAARNIAAHAGDGSLILSPWVLGERAGIDVLAIDQGPMILMIENHRTGLLWKLFMNAPEVQVGLRALSFGA